MREAGSSSSEAPLTIAPPEDELERVVERRAVSILQRFAVFAMTFGPGSAVASYTCLFGWYQQQYHSGEITVWMRLALFAPFPMMKMVQQRYDAYFDERFSTEATYLFRLVIMQIAVSCLMVTWMLLPLHITSSDDVHPILTFGFILGACCAPFIGSSIQVAVAIDPVLFVWAQLGNTVGSTVPVLVSLALEFTPSSSHRDLCKLLAVPLAICMSTSLILGGLHYSGIFAQAYDTITRRRSLQLVPKANPQDDEGEETEDRHVASSIAAAPDEASGEPSDDTTSAEVEGYPLWARLWLGLQTVGIASDFFLLTLIGYFGSSDTTHDLAMATLPCAAGGRLFSLLFRYVPGFEKGPLHIASALLFFLRMGLWLPLILQYFKVLHFSNMQLLLVWSSWILISMMHNTLTDMTVTSNVVDAIKQTVAQLSVTLTYSALFMGMLAASAMVLTRGDGNADISGDAAAPSLMVLAATPGSPLSFAGWLL